jgi:hypothetical protein
MAELQDSIYLLSYDFDRFHYVPRGDGHDVEAFSFDGVTQIRQADEDKILDLPTPTFFYQYECKGYLDQLDSLYALEGCPIFSQRMIDVLLSVGKFAYRQYPIAVLEERGELDPYEDVEKFKRMSLRNDLFIFQTLEFLDIFDWEKSKYSQTDLSRRLNVPGDVSRYVLKAPNNGFPPLFRLPPLYPIDLFISREAREALEKAGITGNGFKSLLHPMGNPEIDVPIQEVLDPQLNLEIEKRQKMIVTVFERAKEERTKGNNDIANRLEQKAHDFMRDIGY